MNPQKNHLSSQTRARFHTALMLSKRIPNADSENSQQRKAAVHAWAMALRAALKERG